MERYGRIFKKFNQIIEVIENTRTIQDQTSYQITYNQLASQYEEKKAELERLKGEKADKQKRAVKVKDVIDTLLISNVFLQLLTKNFGIPWLNKSLLPKRNQLFLPSRVVRKLSFDFLITLYFLKK
ncbi:hypothetical protein [Streptococcus respiraculi]|uniref:hypothetical protein n=1 Tax=Streptococcus respiraculi TaxID=2021971 RepID=UPI000E73132B|nr:hypothetical protein [Streptococcus respiraculi]